MVSFLLISNASLKREWCQYEYYYSFFKRKILIPIVTETLEAGNKSPLHYFQKDINYVHLANGGPDELYSIFSRISDKFGAVKKASQRKIIRVIISLAGIGLLVYIFFQFGLKQINTYSYNEARNTLVEKVEKSNRILTSNELKEISIKFNNDQTLAGRLLILSVDDKISSYASLNADLIIGHIVTNFNLYRKKDIDSIFWVGSAANNYQIPDRSFNNGKIDKVKFEDVNLFNTTFSNTTLADLSFSHCSFAGTFFLPERSFYNRFYRLQILWVYN